MQNRKAKKELNIITIKDTRNSYHVYQVGNRFFVGGRNTSQLVGEFTDLERFLIETKSTVNEVVHYDSFVSFNYQLDYLQVKSRSRIRKTYFGDVLPKMYRNITKLKTDYMVNGRRITSVKINDSKKTFGVYHDEGLLESGFPLYATVYELERAGYIVKIRPTDRFCKDCGRLMDTNQSEIEYCYRCAPNHGYIHCRNCYDWHKPNELQELNGYHYCTKCVSRMTQCRCCGTMSFSNVCDTCRDNTYTMIKSYSHKPDPKMLRQHEADVGRFFGLELELSFEEEWERTKFLFELSKTQFYKEKNVYCKSDGSISNYGVEVVTHPMTQDFIFENAGFLAFADVLYRYGHVNASCGGHIHTNRNVLRADTDTKICYLFNKYPSVCENKSDREDYDDLYQWASPRYDFTKTKTNDFYYFLENADFDERYRALNLKNRNTIEFRIFSGTTDLDTIMSRIEWIEKLITLVETKDIETITEEELL